MQQVHQAIRRRVEGIRALQDHLKMKKRDGSKLNLSYTQVHYGRYTNNTGRTATSPQWSNSVPGAGVPAHCIPGRRCDNRRIHDYIRATHWRADTYNQGMAEVEIAGLRHRQVNPRQDGSRREAATSGRTQRKKSKSTTSPEATNSPSKAKGKQGTQKSEMAIDIDRRTVTLNREDSTRKTSRRNWNSQRRDKP